MIVVILIYSGGGCKTRINIENGERRVWKRENGGS